MANTDTDLDTSDDSGTATMTVEQQCAGLLGDGEDKASNGSTKAQGPTRAEIVARIKKENAERKKRNEAKTAAFQQGMNAYNECFANAGLVPGPNGTLRAPSCPSPPNNPSLEQMAGLPGEPPPAAPDLGLPPETIGYVASTKLQLPKTKINIGPDPSWNEWDKAFVGHPYWLWVDPPAGGLSSSQSVGPITVGLKASLASVTFKTSGEDPLTCTGAGTPYVRTRSNEGKKSPDCGLTFTTKGEKTITATLQWNIQWTVNGQSGTVPMAQTVGRTVEVGELQAVNVDPPR
ncbi:MAG: hypothetical protein L0G99_07865 [Propionibacteriales bacterium]|nr:hypothetical protein [Propionibacteriales bacterium]